MVITYTLERLVPSKAIEYFPTTLLSITRQMIKNNLKRPFIGKKDEVHVEVWFERK